MCFVLRTDSEVFYEESREYVDVGASQQEVVKRSMEFQCLPVTATKLLSGALCHPGSKLDFGTWVSSRCSSGQELINDLGPMA